MTSYRLSKGGLIDRTRSLSFKFDDKQLTGFSGDTLASALLANGCQLVGRSFKYHRPRGILTAGSAEPNALVTVGADGRTEANTRATMIELCDGLIAKSQNRWPSLEFDIGSINSLLSPFLGAGFYYKTFMWPAAFWEQVYEPLIRKAAGLGRASYEADPDYHEKCWAHCDILVVGAGPAGLAASLTAGRAGARVILADEGFELGGALLRETESIAGNPTNEFRKNIIAELADLPNVTLLPRTTVFGWYDDNVFGAVERVQPHISQPDPYRPVEKLWRIIARETILATGAEERPLVFGGNDIPGVMLASATRSYLNRHAIAPGQRTVIFTTNRSGYKAAADLEAAGLEVAAIIDPRAAGQDTWTGKARVIHQAVVRDAHGGKNLTGVTIEANGQAEHITADALAMSGGWSPVIHLACHRGAKPVWSEEKAAFLAPQNLQGLRIAGAATGMELTEACLGDGSIQACKSLKILGFKKIDPAFTPIEETGYRVHTLWQVRNSKQKAFVDFQNDVDAKDIELAVREGYGHVELTKRYTTNGMATDQGKLSNINAIGILAQTRGVSPAEVQTTTFRPFYTPVSFGALTGHAKGRNFQPVRKSPLHDWAKKNGATFVETGLWYRSAWFPRKGETGWRESVDREVRTVRTHAGICDVSTLGKIEIFGKDAAEFLNRVYCNAFLKLPVGRARYGVMLREDGMIYDDGTTSRLSDNHYFMTTTTALAAGVMTHLEFCVQALWPDLDVRLASSTDQWAQMAIAGPRSRDILQTLVDLDLSDAAFPFMSAKPVTLLGGQISARLFRISFSGELAYELAVPAGFGESVADAMMDAGKAYGICPYGTEALGVMRIEKGHVTHAEINGTVTPYDLGLGKMVSATKPDFIGKAMLSREGLNTADRGQLVGIKPLDKTKSFRTGSHILSKGAAATLENDQGYITSSVFSPTLGHMIGLALVKNGSERIGENVTIWNALIHEYTEAVLCQPVFVDPENRKLHA